LEGASDPAGRKAWCLYAQDRRAVPRKRRVAPCAHPRRNNGVAQTLFQQMGHQVARKGTNIMGELKDKAKGIANEVAGEVKQQSGDPVTRSEGRAQERKGEAQNLKGKVKGALGDKV